jgi:hypothetical protein
MEFDVKHSDCWNFVIFSMLINDHSNCWFYVASNYTSWENESG